MSAAPIVATPETRNHGLYALVVAIWGTSWIGLKLQVGADVAVMASVAYRFALAAALLFGWCVLRGLTLRFTPAQHLRMAVQGIILFGINYTFFYGGAQYLTSGLVAVGFSTVIIFNMILGAAVLGQKPEPRLIGGAVLGLGGIALVFWPEVSSLTLADDGAKGVALTLAGTICAAIGMTLSARNQKAGLKVVQGNAFGMAYGAAFLVVVALITGTPFGFATTVEYVGGLIYLAVAGSVIAFGAYLTLVGRIGPSRASYASVLFPILALAVSTAFEGYQWTPVAFGGVALVLMGNLLVLTRPAARPVPASSEA